ncbi:MAG: hypothetical protein OJJ54_03550, partial [Pseudonocardia sp.]|nr:hypothetical protein [Pseudonocardia sp.]
MSPVTHVRPATEPGGVAPTGPARRTTGTSRMRWLQLAAVLAVTALHYLVHLGYTIDDADITFSYVRTFVDGNGLGMLFPGDFRVEGYSNATWFALLAGAAAVGVPILTAAKIYGLVFALGAAATVHAIAWRILADRRLAIGAVVAGLSVPFVLWSASSLESSLMAFLVLLLASVLIVEDEQGSVPWRSAVVAVLIALTRPEGFVYAAAAALFMIVRLVRSPDRAAALRRLAGWLLAVVVALGAYAAWHLSFYGVLFPNTVYAKVQSGGLLSSLLADLDPTGPVARYAAAYAIKDAAILLLPLGLYGAWTALRDRRLAVVVVGLAALALPLQEADWMKHSRFYATFGLLLVLLALIGLDRIVGRGGPGGRARLVRLAAGGSVVVFAAANIVVAGMADRSGYPQWITASEVEQRNQDIAAAGRRAGLVDPLVLVPDIGAPSFEMNLRIVDALGLSDAQVARDLGQADLLDTYLFGERRPDLVRLHWPHDVDAVPVDRIESLRRDYVQIPAQQDQGSPRAWIRREDLTVPPSTAGPALATGGGVSYLGSTTSAVRPDQAAALDLLWTGGAGARTATAFDVTVRGTDGAVLQTFHDDLGYGWLPPTSWRDGEVLRSHVPLQGLPTGEYRVEVTTTDAAGTVVAGHTQTLQVGAQAAAGAATAELGAASAALDAGDWTAFGAACRATGLIDGTGTCAPLTDRARDVARSDVAAALAR